MTTRRFHLLITEEFGDGSANIERYSQRKDDLDVDGLIRFVNTPAKTPRAPRSDAGKGRRRRGEASPETPTLGLAPSTPAPAK